MQNFFPGWTLSLYGKGEESLLIPHCPLQYEVPTEINLSELTRQAQIDNHQYHWKSFVWRLRNKPHEKTKKAIRAYSVGSTE